MGIKDDAYWMGQALDQAVKARQLNEVPVGAVVVKEEQLIGKGYNSPITSQDPTAHAEIIALRQAAYKLNNYRIVDATLYVTLEPCAMCVAAASHARIANIVFGVADEKTGALCSHVELFHSKMLLSKMTFQGGIRADESRRLLQSFFKLKRKNAEGV